LGKTASKGTPKKFPKTTLRGSSLFKDVLDVKRETKKRTMQVSLQGSSGSELIIKKEKKQKRTVHITFVPKAAKKKKRAILERKVGIGNPRQKGWVTGLISDRKLEKQEN